MVDISNLLQEKRSQIKELLDKAPRFVMFISFKDRLTSISELPEDKLNVIFDAIFAEFTEFPNVDSAFRWESDKLLLTLSDFVPKTDLYHFLRKIEKTTTEAFNLDLSEVRLIASICSSDNDELLSDVISIAEGQLAIASLNVHGIAYSTPNALNIRGKKHFLKVFNKGEITTVGQPIIDSATQELFAVEILIRYTGKEFNEWNNPQKLISDSKDSKNLFKITTFVIRQACKWIQTLEEHGINCPVSINLSAQQMSQPFLFEKLNKILTEKQIDRSKLIIEMTEEHDPKVLPGSESFLQNCKDAGFTLALDDVGSGYNGLLNIASGYFNILKLDKFIALNSAEIILYSEYIKSVSDLAATQGMDLVIEGIEIEQLELPTGPHIKHQGYLYSKPIGIDQFINLYAPQQIHKAN